MWYRIMEETSFQYPSFNIHQIYPDNVILNLAISLAKYANITVENVMCLFGKKFVSYFKLVG